jgi:hypothetical protein
MSVLLTVLLAVLIQGGHEGSEMQGTLSEIEAHATPFLICLPISLFSIGTARIFFQVSLHKLLGASAGSVAIFMIFPIFRAGAALLSPLQQTRHEKDVDSRPPTANYNKRRRVWTRQYGAARGAICW